MGWLNEQLIEFSKLAFHCGLGRTNEMSADFCDFKVGRLHGRSGLRVPEEVARESVMISPSIPI
jgi:hypothetical protein